MMEPSLTIKNKFDFKPVSFSFLGIGSKRMDSTTTTSPGDNVVPFLDIVDILTKQQQNVPNETKVTDDEKIQAAESHVHMARRIASFLPGYCRKCGRKQDNKIHRMGRIRMKNCHYFDDDTERSKQEAERQKMENMRPPSKLPRKQVPNKDSEDGSDDGDDDSEDSSRAKYKVYIQRRKRPPTKLPRPPVLDPTLDVDSDSDFDPFWL